jgi:hypothetical protein
METISVPYSRFAATFRFHVDCCAQWPVSDTFSGSIELFEHKYSGEFCFWYGVAQIECNYSYDFCEAIKKAGGPERVSVQVQLPDGRSGLAWVLHPQVCSDGFVAEPVCLGLLGSWPLRGPA